MDFALIMFVLLVVTGGIWLGDRFLLAPKRGSEAAEPWWVEYAKSFFPVILIVFCIQDTFRLDDAYPASG
jgi:signal peptidase I